MDTRLRASPRHGGQEFFKMLVIDPPRGVPSGAAALIILER